MQQSIEKRKILSMPAGARLARGGSAMPNKTTIPNKPSMSTKPARTVPKPTAKQAGDHRALEASMSAQHPPETLVKTWMWMMSVSKDRELNVQGRNRLMDNFGSIQAAVDYIKERM